MLIPDSGGRNPGVSLLSTLISKRVILVSGKGGVGRSTLAATLAWISASRGKKTLLTEVGDWASSESTSHGSVAFSPLARVFGSEQLPSQPSGKASLLPLSGNESLPLFAAPASSRTGQELFLRTVIPSETVVRAALNSDAIRKLVQFAPSLREMGIFFHLLTWLRQDWETIVVDMPATGHALGMTGLPEILLRVLPRGPIADALREGQSHLNDPGKTAAVVVTLPEQLPVTEALELAEGLKRTQVEVAGFVVNRVPPNPFTPAERTWLREWLEKSTADARPFGAEAFERFDEIENSIARLERESFAKGRGLAILQEMDSLAAPREFDRMRALARAWEGGGLSPQVSQSAPPEVRS